MTRETGPVIFLSASVPDGKRPYEGHQRHHASARPQRIRDAVLALVREAFRLNYRIVIGAHPSISPMILTVVNEFPASAPPRVAVFQSEFFAANFPAETLALADGKRGTLELVPPQGIPPEREASLLEMRTRMFNLAGLIGAVFVGGMSGILDEANLFLAQNQQYGLPAYAIESGGGASADLLDVGLVNQPAWSFEGSPSAPIQEAVLRSWRQGYRPVAREIFRCIQAARTSGNLQPRP